MRIVALILVVIGAHMGYRGAVILGGALQDGGNLSSGPEGLMYLLLAAVLLLAASLVRRLELFTTTPARTVNMHEHNHVAPPEEAIPATAGGPTARSFSGITSPAPRPPASASAGHSGRTILVDFDLQRVRHNHWESKGRSATDEEVRVWLMSVGFIPTPDGWLGDEANLQQFGRDEIIRCRSIARSNNQLEETRRRQVEQVMRQRAAESAGSSPRPRS